MAFLPPIDVSPTQGWFSARRRRLHEGLDFRAPIGTPVRAAASGKVVISRDWGDGTGKWIVIEHDGENQGFTSRYLHLSKRLASVGDHVKQGETIAYSGNTGDSAAPHLHFDMQADPAHAFAIPLRGRVFLGRRNIPAEIFIPLPLKNRPKSLAGPDDEEGIPLERDAPGVLTPTQLNTRIMVLSAGAAFAVATFAAQIRGR